MISASAQMDVTCAGHHVGPVHWIPLGQHKLWLYDARNVHRFCMMCQCLICCQWQNCSGVCGGCSIRDNNVVCRSFNRLRDACSCSVWCVYAKRFQLIQDVNVLLQFAMNSMKSEIMWKYYCFTYEMFLFTVPLQMRASLANAHVKVRQGERSCWSKLLGIWYLFCHYTCDSMYLSLPITN